MRSGKVLTVLALAAGLVLLGPAAPVWADDMDGDGVDDPMDVCNDTPADTAVDAEGRPLGDLDQDCDTDLDDFALFQQGFTGPLAPPGLVATVPVGNPGNPHDTHGPGYGDYGRVDYKYNIGTYEVTARQYAAFLNAVAATDPYGLYHPFMDSDSSGCQITQNGSSPNFTYDFSGRPSGTEADWADRPVNYVSWGDAVRFANWLHNGRPKGAQDLTTTEDGSYYLDGATSDAELLAVVRELDATWVIPSEDEWHKAAYHYNDGVTGNYWDFPTSSDSMPGYVDNSGNLSGTGTAFTEGGTDPGNYATYDHDLGTDGIGSPYFRTEVGEWENSGSPYGTFDQGGNVWEWNETVLYDLYRGFSGGSFINIEGDMHAAHHGFNFPEYASLYVGFRVAEVP